MYFDILCKYYSTSGITSYSIDFLIYNSWLFTTITYFFHFLNIFRCLRLCSPLSPLSCLILVFSDSHDNLIIDFGWELSFDVHEGLQENLLPNEFKLLLLVLLFYEVYLLETVETLACLEVHFLGELKHQVVEVPHCFQWLAWCPCFRRLKSFIH